MTRKELNDSYTKYTRNATDYRNFYEHYFPNCRKTENYISIENYEETYEFDDETRSAIQKYNELVKKMNESKTTELEKDILISKIYKYSVIIENYCIYNCRQHIKFGSDERQKTAKKIKKQLKKLLTK